MLKHVVRCTGLMTAAVALLLNYGCTCKCGNAAKSRDSQAVAAARAVPQVSPREAKDKLAASARTRYLDVRSVEEFEAGHVPGAVNIPLMHRNPAGSGMIPNDAFLAEVEKLIPRDTPLVVGCRASGRSDRATMMMIDAGYTDVYSMRGGFSGKTAPDGTLLEPGWTNLGFPVETGR